MAGLRTVRNPQTGLLELTADSFSDPSVPGASAAPQQAEFSQPVVDAINDQNAVAATEQVNAASEQNAQAQTELTDEQKAAEEQRKAQIKASKAQLATQKAQLDQADAEASLAEPGLEARPEPEAELVEQPAVQEAVAPQGQALVESGFNQLETGTEEAANAEIARVEQAADNLGTLGDETIAAANEQAVIQEQREKVKQKLSNIDKQIQAEIDTKIKKPSPSALSLIGVFLNGLIAPYQGGRNVALELVTKQLQQEVDLELNQKRQRLGALKDRQGIVSDESSEIGREAAAAGILTAQKLKGFEMQMQAELDKGTLPPQIAANMQKVLGEIGIKRGEVQKKATLTAARIAFDREKLAMQRAAAQAKLQQSRRRGSGGGGRVKPVEQQQRVQTLLKGAGLDPKKLANRELIGTVKVVGPDGKPVWGFVGTGAAAMKKFNAKAVSSERNLDTMGELARLVQQDGIGIDTPLGKTERAARIQSVYSKLLVDLKTQFELGAISGPDMDLMKGVIGRDPAELLNLTPDTALASLEELYNMSRDDMSAAVRANSLGKAEYAPRLSWKSLTKPIGSGRGKTNRENNLQLDALAKESVPSNPQDAAKRAIEVTSVVDNLMGDGINAGNIADAEKMLKTLDGLPKRLRRKFNEETSADRHLQLTTKIQEYKKRTQKRDIEADIKGKRDKLRKQMQTDWRKRNKK